MKEIVASTGNSRVEMMDLDLTSLASVNEFAKSVIARSEPLQVKFCYIFQLCVCEEIFRVCWAMFLFFRF